MSVRVAILGHVGNGNLGDEAIITSTLANLRAALPEAEIIAITAKPADTTARHGIPAFPVYGYAPPAVAGAAAQAPAGGARALVKRTLARVPPLFTALRAVRDGMAWLAHLAGEPGRLWLAWRHLDGVRLLLVAGSGQVNDYYGGVWGYPYRLLKWSLLTRLRGGRVAYVSVGAGPITARLSRWMLRAALALADYRSYRDEPSLALAEELGVRHGNRLAPDLAFGLEPAAPAAPAGFAPPATRPTVVISPLPFQMGGYWHESDAQGYASYVAELATFATWLTGNGFAVRFVPTQFAVDPAVIDDIVAAMRARQGAEPEHISVTQPRTVDDLLAALSGVAAVVATRYHGVLLSLALGNPTIGIAYHPKTVALLAAFGQERFALPIDRLDAATLVRTFDELRQAKSERAAFVRRREDLRSALSREFAELARLVRVTPRPAPEPNAVTP